MWVYFSKLNSKLIRFFDKIFDEINMKNTGKYLYSAFF